MSVTLTLIPLAVAVGVSLTSASAAILLKQGGKSQEIPPLETVFMDQAVLRKTLNQHGLQIQSETENELFVRSESGTLRYFRSDSSLPFSLELKDICNMREMLDSLDELENEYGRNVQSFTYHKVMTSLAEHGMSVESEEIMEDESILLTLNL